MAFSAFASRDLAQNALGLDPFGLGAKFLASDLATFASSSSRPFLNSSFCLLERRLSLQDFASRDTTLVCPNPGSKKRSQIFFHCIKYVLISSQRTRLSCVNLSSYLKSTHEQCTVPYFGGVGKCVPKSSQKQGLLPHSA